MDFNNIMTFNSYLMNFNPHLTKQVQEAIFYRKYHSPKNSDLNFNRLMFEKKTLETLTTKTKRIPQHFKVNLRL